MQLFRSSFFLALLSGLLTVAIFPRWDAGWLAFVCLVPLFLLITDSTPRRLFGWFFWAGLVFHMGNLYWIVHVIQHYTRLGLWLSMGVLLLLCLTLSLLWGLVGWLSGRINQTRGYSLAMMVIPFLWIAQEYVRNLLQFPWCLLGYSQYRNLWFAQTASLSGVYGLSFLLVAFNASLALFLRTRKKYYIISTIIIVLVAHSYGYFEMQEPVRGKPLRIGIVQGNIPQDIKIDYQFADEVNQKHIRLTETMIASRPVDLVLWSESATLYPLKFGGEWTDQVRRLAIRSQTPLLIGSDSYRNEKVFNSAFVINEKGEMEDAEYSKIYLVPFGEFVPLKSLFFFAGKVVPEISDFSPGEKYTIFRVRGHPLAVHICFEVVFPQLSRTFVRHGAGLLVTITNDAWFGRTCAPYQHFAQAILRSIETRRYLARAANTGISGFVDPYGRIIGKTDIFVETTLIGEVKSLSGKTFYVRYGDILVFIALIISVAAFLLTLGGGFGRGSQSSI